jgi:hypothetical protein
MNLAQNDTIHIVFPVLVWKFVQNFRMNLSVKFSAETEFCKIDPRPKIRMKTRMVQRTTMRSVSLEGNGPMLESWPLGALAT